jgi:hypothetical protein
MKGKDSGMMKDKKRGEYFMTTAAMRVDVAPWIVLYGLINGCHFSPPS